jgi:hypothetical protein
MAVLMSVVVASGALARERDTAGGPASGAGGRVSAPAGTAKAMLAVDRSLESVDGIEIISSAIDFGELTLDSERKLDRAVIIRVTSSRDWVLRIVPESNSFRHAANLLWRSQWSRRFRPLTGFAEVAQGKATGPAGTLVMLDLKFSVGDTESTGQFQTAFGFELVPR